jgi:hypothetical protein
MSWVDDLFKTGGLTVANGSQTQNIGPGFGNYGSQDVYKPQPTGSVLGITTVGNRVAAPQTGGQPTGGSGGNPNQANNDAYLQNIKDQYGQNRDYVQNSLLPGAERDYNLAKGDISNALTDAQNTANTQKDSVNTQFGDILKNQVRTYQDLGRQRTGIFSGLGTLDSSAYNEQNFRAGQDLSNQRNETDLQKTKALGGIDQQFSSYQKQAESQLGQLASQYQSGTDSLRNALAQNNIQEAGAIQSALSQIQQQAQELDTNRKNWATQAALLKSQGVDVMGALSAINGNDYGQQVGQQLAQANAFGKSLIPQVTGLNTAGYINTNKKDDQLNPYLPGALPGLSY